MAKDGDTVKGNKYVFEAGSMQLNIIQNNYPKNQDQRQNFNDGDFVDFEEETAEQPVNLIFKKFHDGKRIDFKTIRKILEEKLVNEMTNKYEWYAAYRMLYDLKIMEVVQLSKFAEQMNTWFPDAVIPCNKDSLGDYATGHTGKPFTLWSLESFRADKKKGQSESGFNTLYNHCQELKVNLTPIPVLAQ